MKTSFKVLIVLLLACAANAWMNQWNNHSQYSFQGKLSDITRKISAISVQLPYGCKAEDIHSVQQDGRDLFILCNRTLFHCNKTGKLLSSVKLGRENDSREGILLFTLNTSKKEVVAIGSNRQAYYYSYTGDLLRMKDLGDTLSGQTLKSLNYYDHQLLATVEPVTDNGALNGCEKKLCRFTPDFQEISQTELSQPDLGKDYLAGNFDPEPAVDGNRIYVHSPSLFPETLLNDTMYLIQSGQIETGYQPGLPDTAVLPVRINNRYLISTHCNKSHKEENYTFLLDRVHFASYMAQGGLEDDFCNSGKIADLKPLNLRNEIFYFCRDTAKNAEDKAPHPAKSITLYLVELKG